MDTTMKRVCAVLAAGLMAAGVAACDRRNATESVSQNTTGTTTSSTTGTTTDTTAANTAGTTTDTNRTAGQTVDDATITMAVKAEYAKDKEVDALKINVDTVNGVVTLNGTAPSETGRMKAESLAMSVKGVSKVNNNLTVKTG